MSFFVPPPAGTPTGDCRHAFDPESFELFIRPHVPRVLAAARRICADQDLARDALQEALIELWHRPELPTDVRAWLVRTVVHRALCAARGERRRRRRERCVCGVRPELTFQVDPAQLALESEQERLLDDALETLPREQREVYLLREREGLDYEQIASTLDLPLGTVRSRLSRARSRLARECGLSHALA